MPVLVAKSPEELESMLTDIHLASKPVGLSMNLSKTNDMLNENAIKSTVAVDENIIDVYPCKTVTQVREEEEEEEETLFVNGIVTVGAV